MNSRAVCSVGVVLLAVAGWGACRSSPDPAALVAEADSLRSQFEEDASRRAIARYREAVAVLKRRGDRRGAARAALAAGATWVQLGTPQESLAPYREALALARSAADPLLESEARSETGIAYALLTDLDSAVAECDAALDLARRFGGTREEARAQICLGEVDYNRFRDHRGALAHYRAAEPLSRRAGDQRGEAESLLYQGWVHSDLRELDRAESCYERARALWIPRDDKRGRALLTLADARLQQRRGRYQEALNAYLELLPLLQPSGDTFWYASTLTGVADVYLQMAATADAVEYWKRAYEMFAGAGLSNLATEALMTLGATYLASGDDRTALPYLLQADELTARLGSDRWRPKTLRYLAVVDLIHGRPEQARSRLEQSLAIQRGLGNDREPGLAARTSADMGDAYLMLGDTRIAADWFREALGTSRAAVNRVEEARALFGLGRAAAALDDLDTARGHLRDALAVVESLRTAVENRDLRTSFFASVYQYHEVYLDVLMRLDRGRPGRGLAAMAFGANERARARSLLESLANAKVDLRSGVDPALLARENEIRLGFDAWAERQRRLSAEGLSEAGAQALRQGHRDLEERHAQVQAEIRSRSPRYADLAQPLPLDLGQIQRQVLDSTTLLLEYALGDQRSYLWAVSQTDYSSFVLPPRDEIEGTAQRVYSALANGQRTADRAIQEETRRLSELLLGPVAGRLAGKRLLVVADGALQYVPFGALPVPGRAAAPVPLLAEHEVVSLPSASVLAVLRRETAERPVPGGAVAVLADPVFEADDPRVRAALRTSGRTRPAAASGGGSSSRGVSTVRTAEADSGEGLTVVPPRLATTRQEADVIAKLAEPAPVLTWFGFDANRAAVQGPVLGRYRVVHFATHGVFNNEHPGLSGIYLSLFDGAGQAQAGFLNLHDIYGLQLPVELVVLSACNTALGRLVRGEGLVGIVRGFMYAGAKRVVASLWKVDDEATAALMGHFYRALLKEHCSPAAALRQAQLAVSAEARWQAPYYWAAFVLQGEWR